MCTRVSRRYAKNQQKTTASTTPLDIAIERLLFEKNCSDRIHKVKKIFRQIIKLTLRYICEISNLHRV